MRSHLRALRLDFSWRSRRPALLTTMLAYQAWLMCDAIGRTLWRMFVSHRHLLEWMPADMLSSTRTDFGSFYRRMVRSVVLTLLLAALARRATPATLPDIAVPFLLLWLAAPLVAWRISRTPPAVAKSDLSARASSASCA